MILAIETSCDDSSVALMRMNGELIFEKRISQIEHNNYGGVVPELAARLHASNLPDLIEMAKKYFSDLKAVAVTNEPGLALSLAQGLMAAKALSIALDIPLIGVHHLKGHLYSVFIGKKSLFPIDAIVASGGHTCILRCNGYDDFKEVGSSLDDSLGEAFDKTAKMLDLGYPGGKIVEQEASLGDENAFNLTIPMQKTKDIVFSYSGLKNAVRLLVQEHGKARSKDICASFQKTAIAHLLQKCEIFFQKYSPKDLALVGGVSANMYLRSKLEALCKNYGVQLHLCKQQFTQDNAAMIARAAIDAYKQGLYSKDLELDIRSKSPFEKLQQGKT